MIKFLRLGFLFFLYSTVVKAQDDLLKELEGTAPKEVSYTFQTFKGTRLVNGQSVETKSKGALEFIFAHRFGALNSGSYEMFGLDQAYVRLGLEYGITDRLGIGIGRSSRDKIADAYLRYKIFRQQKGGTNFPFTITAFGDVSHKGFPQTGVETIDRIAYVGQLLIARKFSQSLSLQLMPTLVHRNGVDQLTENNDQIALGFGGRIKLSRSIALTGEYYYRVNAKVNTLNYDAIGFGIDIETGGHVFQIVLTNTLGVTERAVVTETTGNFFDGGIHLGFNVTRTFQVKKENK